ncbi:MAG: hypothetical protein ACI31V_05970 [Bacilli bacterium]
MTFLKELKENEIGIGTYFRIRKDNTVELGYENLNSQEEYNNTRLIIDPIPIKKENKRSTFKCKVSWFNRNDKVYFPKDENGNIGYDEKSSKNIIVELNIEKLVTDKNYYEFFMEKLINKERVLKYLEYGMIEEPEIKCGDYIGYIEYDEQGRLNRYFDEYFGIECHTLESKQIERNNKKTELLIFYNNEIEKHKKAIEEINNKIEELYKEEKEQSRTLK